MIHQLRQNGLYQAEMPEKFSCSVRSVRRQLKGSEPPNKPSRKRDSKLGPFKACVDERLSDNVWNTEVIFQELRERGYQGGRSIF